jgi:hypothetical protein
MLHLVNSNKGKRNFNEISTTNGAYWKELFKTSEDSLTSSVFGLLFYLPPELFWSILRSSCYTNELPKHVGRILSYEFWPRWGNAQETFTEPDIYIEFEGISVIIEAKKSDYNQQNINQWIAEVNSYFKSIDTDNKAVFVVAVGGIRKGDEEATHLQVPNVPKPTTVVKTRWRQLLSEILKTHKEIERTSRLLYNNAPLMNILKDLILAFRIHGFLTAALFNTFPVNTQLSSYTLETIKIPPRLKPFSNFALNLLFIKNSSIKIFIQQI